MSGKVAGTHTNEVVGFILDPADFPEAMPGGTDLRFTTIGGAVLDHELVSWAGSEAIFYFRADALTDGSQFVVYYGNPDSTSTPPIRNTWANWAAVYHFEEDPTTNNRLTDSSGNGVHGTLSAQAGYEWASGTRVAGAVGYGWDYEWQRVTTTPDMNVTGDWTVFTFHNNTANKNQCTGLFMYSPNQFYWDLAGRGDITISTRTQTEYGLRGYHKTGGVINDGGEFVYAVLRCESGVDDGIEMFQNGALQDTSWEIMHGVPWPPLGVPVNDNLDLVGTNKGASEPFGVASASYTNNESDGNSGTTDEFWIYDGLANNNYIALLYQNLADNAAFWVVSPTIEVGDVPVGATSWSAIKRRY